MKCHIVVTSPTTANSTNSKASTATKMIEGSEKKRINLLVKKGLVKVL